MSSPAEKGAEKGKGRIDEEEYERLRAAGLNPEAMEDLPSEAKRLRASGLNPEAMEDLRSEATGDLERPSVEPDELEPLEERPSVEPDELEPLERLDIAQQAAVILSQYQRFRDDAWEVAQSISVLGELLDMKEMILDYRAPSTKISGVMDVLSLDVLAPEVPEAFRVLKEKVGGVWDSLKVAVGASDPELVGRSELAKTVLPSFRLLDTQLSDTQEAIESYLHAKELLDDYRPPDGGFDQTSEYRAQVKVEVQVLQKLLNDFLVPCDAVNDYVTRACEDFLGQLGEDVKGKIKSNFPNVHPDAAARLTAAKTGLGVVSASLGAAALAGGLPLAIASAAVAGVSTAADKIAQEVIAVSDVVDVDDTLQAQGAVTYGKLEGDDQLTYTDYGLTGAGLGPGVVDQTSGEIPGAAMHHLAEASGLVARGLGHGPGALLGAAGMSIALVKLEGAPVQPRFDQADMDRYQEAFNKMRRWFEVDKELAGSDAIRVGVGGFDENGWFAVDFGGRSGVITADGKFLPAGAAALEMAIEGIGPRYQLNLDNQPAESLVTY